MLVADRTSEALLAYHQAIQTDTSNHSAIKKLIPLYQQQGRMREAAALFQKLGEAEKSGLIDGSSESSPAESDALKLRWFKAPIQDVPVGMAADSEMVVVTYSSGQVALLQINDGTLIWSKNVGKTITSAPSLSTDAVFLGCESGSVIALDRATGKQLWEILLPGTIYASVFVDQEYGYVGSYNGKMTALDLSTGSILWQTETGNAILNQPVLVKDSLYFGTTAGTVYSLDRKTGAALWKKPARLSGSLEAKPVVVDDMLLMPSNDSRLYALDLNGRDYYWQYSTPDSQYSSPIVQENRIYVFSIGQVAAALDLLSGNPIWEQDLPVPVRTTPVLAGGKLFFAGVTQSLYLRWILPPVKYPSGKYRRLDRSRSNTGGEILAVGR